MKNLIWLSLVLMALFILIEDKHKSSPKQPQAVNSVEPAKPLEIVVKKTYIVYYSSRRSEYGGFPLAQSRTVSASKRDAFVTDLESLGFKYRVYKIGNGETYSIQFLLEGTHTKEVSTYEEAIKLKYKLISWRCNVDVKEY